MALGAPVVAVDSGGPAEILTHGRTGLLSPDAEPEHLAEPILALLRNPALRRQIADRAGQEVRRRFSAERMGAQFAAVVRSCVGGRDSAAS
jgi:glycosyltransferase involved in cell wall biosynthesis